VRRGACSTNPEPDHCVLSFVVWRQVCGFDNVTYSSVWELMCVAQRQRKRESSAVCTALDLRVSSLFQKTSTKVVLNHHSGDFQHTVKYKIDAS